MSKQSGGGRGWKKVEAGESGKKIEAKASSRWHWYVYISNFSTVFHTAVFVLLSKFKHRLTIGSEKTNTVATSTVLFSTHSFLLLLN